MALNMKIPSEKQRRLIHAKIELEVQMRLDICELQRCYANNLDEIDRSIAEIEKRSKEGE